MPQGMESDTRRYLAKVANSLAIGLLWMFSNVFGGLWLGYGTISQRISLGNIAFFAWFVVSLGLIILYYVRTWK